jgi:hypothetical protein
MKATKVLKRLTKIEALLSDVMERYSSAPYIREALQDAKTAVTRAKKAVSGPASSGAAKHPTRKYSAAPAPAATPEKPKAKTRISEEGIARIVAATKKRWAAFHAAKAKAASAAKRTPARKKAVAKKAAPAAG